MRILVVDDSLVNQRLSLRVLEKLGYCADVAGDGVQAVAAVLAGEYDVVFMDIQMPEMSGIEATLEIRRRMPGNKLPYIIGMTAGPTEADRVTCAEVGMSGFVAKPARVEDLQYALERFAKGRVDQGLRTTAVDRGGLLRAKEITFGGDDELMREASMMFLSICDQQFREVERFVAERSGSQLMKAAHLLKGGLLSFGFESAAKLAYRLEKWDDKKNSFEECNEVLLELRREFTLLKTDLRNYLDQTVKNAA